MQFLCLVHFAPDAFAGMGPEDQARLTDATIVHDHELSARGHLIAARPLTPPRTARILAKRGGRLHVTDGPFTEAREQIGGFILIDAEDLDAAVALIAESPIAAHATIEIRPILEQTHSRTGQSRPAIVPMSR